MEAYKTLGLMFEKEQTESLEIQDFILNLYEIHAEEGTEDTIVD